MHKWFMAIGFITLFLFVFLSKYEDRAVIRNMDFAATVKIQERIEGSSHLRFTSVVGNIMEGATFFASPEFTVIITLITTGLLLYDRKLRRWNIWALVIPVALIFLVGIEVYGKSVVHHPAPPFSMIKHPTTIFPADYINEQYSYPSGHAARAIFLSIVTIGTLSIYTSFSRKTLMFSVLISSMYVAIVSVSRIYLGHHWLSDVIGGLLLGGGLTSLITYIFFIQETHSHG